MTLSGVVQPVQLTNNTLNNVVTGIMLGAYENYSLSNNTISSGGGGGRGIQLLPNATASVSGGTIKKFATGILVDGSANINNVNLFFNSTGLLVEGTGSATIHNSNLTGNTSFGVNNTTGVTLDATANFWGSCDGPGIVGPGHGDKVSSNVNFSYFITALPAGYLQTLVNAASAGDTIQLAACTYKGATVNKPLTILGLGPNLNPAIVRTTIVTQGSEAFTISAPDVTIGNMIIVGNPSGTTPVAFDAIVVKC